MPLEPAAGAATSLPNPFMCFSFCDSVRATPLLQTDELDLQLLREAAEEDVKKKQAAGARCCLAGVPCLCYCSLKLPCQRLVKMGVAHRAVASHRWSHANGLVYDPVCAVAPGRGHAQFAVSTPVC